MNKRLIYCLLFSVVTLSASAIDTDYRLSFRGGAIMPDGKVYKSAGLNKNGWVGPVYGAEFAATFHPEWTAMKEWNDAGLGIAVNYWHLDNNRLGDAISPYAFMDIPLVRVPHFAMGIRAGVGVSFLTKTYRNTIAEGLEWKELTNANQSIGSVFNFCFPEALYLEFPIAKGFSLFATGAWFHISNGSLVQPNSGYNIFAGEVGARYTPASNRTPDDAWIKKPDSRKKNWEVELAFTGGARQVYYRDQQTFFCGEIQAAAYWRAHNIFRLGGGVDVFYDGSYIQRETRFGKTNLQAASANGSDCWRVGVSIQPEFVIGKFTAGFHFGCYLLDPIKNLEPMDEAIKAGGKLDKPIFYSYDLLNAGSAGYPDGWLYTQIVMRYRLPWHFFVQGTMKAHLTKIEFVSLGLGAWL